MLTSLCRDQFEAFIAQQYYIPFFISMLALIAAYMVAKTFNKIFLTGEKIFKIGKKEAFKISLDRFKVVTVPFLTLIFLSISGVITQKLTGNHDFVTVLLTMTVIWLVLAGVWAMTSNRSITSLVAVVVTAAVLLNIFGLLTPTITLLDSWSIHLSNYTISMYQLLKGIFILLLLLFLTRKSADMGQHYIHKLQNINVNTRELLAKLFQISLYFIALLVLLDLMGLNWTSLTIFTSAVVLGVGFGTQKLASNVLSGMMLLFEKTIEIGDILELKDGSWAWVRHLGARAALLECFDGREIIMPNDELITQTVTNLTYTHAKLRIEIRVRVPYQVDLELARRLIWEAALSAPLCSKMTPPDCFLYEFGEHGALFLVHVWTDDVTRGRFRPKSEAMFAIWKKLRDHGIDLPYEQHNVILSSPLGELPQK